MPPATVWMMSMWRIDGSSLASSFSSVSFSPSVAPSPPPGSCFVFVVASDEGGEEEEEEEEGAGRV